MPTKEFQELEIPFVVIGGKKFEKPVDLTEQIETSELE